jgi:hypothetical protein
MAIEWPYRQLDLLRIYTSLIFGKYIVRHVQIFDAFLRLSEWKKRFHKTKIQAWIETSCRAIEECRGSMSW